LDSPDNPTIEFTVFDGDKRVDAMASTFVQGLRDAPEGDGVDMRPRLIILDIQSDDELVGKDLRVGVSVVDRDMRSATDQRIMRAVAHPNNR
jgi:hypothetical protein